MKKFQKNLALFIIIFLILDHNGVAQSHKTVTIKATLWDYETGLDLPTTISAFWKGKKIGIDKDEILLSKNTDTLLFESSGYVSFKYPVHFFGNFEKETYTTMLLSTLKLGNKVAVMNHLALCKPAVLDSSFKFDHNTFRLGSLRCTTNLDALMSKKFGPMLMLCNFNEADEYQFLITSENAVIAENRFMSKEGICFVDFTVNPLATSQTTAPKAIETYAINVFGVRTFFFEQSNYDLLPENKQQLDSLISQLKQLLNYSIKIKGFTDQTGNAQKNTTLAEYRAKVMANYLISKGLKQENILIDWEKQSKDRPIGQTEEDLKKYRKAIITVEQ